MNIDWHLFCILIVAQVYSSLFCQKSGEKGDVIVDRGRRRENRQRKKKGGRV